MAGKSVRYKELGALGVPYSKMHVDRLEKAGRFPKRAKFGHRTIAWDRDEIIAWVAAFFNARGQSEKKAA